MERFDIFSGISGANLRGPYLRESLSVDHFSFSFKLGLPVQGRAILWCIQTFQPGRARKPQKELVLKTPISEKGSWEKPL